MIENVRLIVKAEIASVLAFGVKPENIIYANPCKPTSHLRYSQRQGVRLMTFDNAEELTKIAQVDPQAQVVVRILTDDSSARCAFSKKFGVSVEGTAALIEHAKNLGLDVVGVSFHVGSGCTDANTYNDAVRRARDVFTIAERYGFKLSLLDVGGGFPRHIKGTV